MTSISTNNWDTAFGTKFKDANAAIVAQKTSPASFTGSHSVVGGSIAVTGTFGDWQLSGGSGSLLQMTLPITAGTVSGAGQAQASYAGSAVIQISLGFIPQPGNTVNDLKPDAHAPASVLSLTLASGPDSASDAIKGALGDWLNTSLDQFNHVFAAVDLSTSVDTGDFAWLQPTYLGYAIYTENFASVDDYLFGVLAMTENRTGSRLSPELDPGIIPAGSDAGFLISPTCVMQQMFEPHVADLFKGDTPASFDYLDAGMTLYNTTVLGLPDFTLSDGHKVTDASINADGFSLAIGSGSVVIAFTGLTFTYKPGYTVTVDYRSVNAMATDSDGHLQLTQTGAPTVSMSISESSGQKWKEIWEGIGISIAAAIVGAVIGGVAEAGLAARAAANAISAGVDASVDGTVSIELNPVVAALSPQEQLQADIAALKSAVTQLKNADAAVGFAGFFRANAFKLLGAAIGAAIGGSVGSIPAILDGYADDDRDRMPTLDDFAANAIGSTQWAQGTSYTLTSAALNTSLQLGLTAAKS
ncbi:TULIP family P47-like protein [Variovorax sp. dw_954]|uniref:TULIP family P47-like protein n=1 Tax=Variovorax sp. dw_954 TaxID=2720078 RepID=UPI001BD2628F|nr:TULIP family P47-like protein [Variovorax sp. dw_954]